MNIAPISATGGQVSAIYSSRTSGGRQNVSAQDSLVQSPSTALPGPGFTQSEKSLISSLTGAEVNDDGTVDFTAGSAAGRNTGVIPEGYTVVGASDTDGNTVEFYGAASRNERVGGGVGQGADLPHGTLTGMKIILGSNQSAARRQSFLNMALKYVVDLNQGKDKQWAPHAVFDITA